MELTGRCKVYFEEWFNRFSLIELENNGSPFFMPKLELFYQLPESMKWGVYVDFFDSKNIHLCSMMDFNKKWIFYINHSEYGNFKTRLEARFEAIKKINNIYNSVK